MSGRPRDNPALPARNLAIAHNQWLADARARLLRSAGIARARRVLEIGAGWGICAEELLQRSSGDVFLLDHDRAALRESKAFHTPNVHRLAADAHCLPLAVGSFDLVFAQCVFLWLTEPARALQEAVRVLRSGGSLAAIEPDYGGLMEWPPDIESRPLWIEALRRAGADPLVGRKLPAWMRAAGLEVEVKFFERLKPARHERWDLLAELPLTDEQQQRLEAIRRCTLRLDHADVHLPYWLALGRKAG
jgi:ubiquinone/menaquinone biosynthesis C-methylase UbiE